MRSKFLLLTGVLMLAFTGCGTEGDSSSDANSGNVVDDSAESESTVEDGSADAESEGADDSADAESEDAEGEDSSDAESESTEGEGSEDAKSEGVMTYDKYMAAALDSEVVIETYVQAKQAWWEDKATVYTQDKDGGYFLYNLTCSEEDYAKLTPGTKIKVTGYKTEWSGEVEVAEGGTFEIMDGSYIAEAEDVTSLLGTDDLIKHQNKFVSFKGMTVEAAGQDDDGNDVAFLYKYDGSGQDGDDLYFNVSLDGQTYTFTVESYLCDNTTDVYAAVKALNVGDKIDMEGFLYWYEGVNPHITSVTAAN